MSVVVATIIVMTKHIKLVILEELFYIVGSNPTESTILKECIMTIRTRLINKAKQSQCAYKIAAIALSKKKNIIAYSINSFRFSKSNGGIHAERELMQKYGSKIENIIICRVNKNGTLLPIEPCKTCQKIARKLNIKITAII